MAENVVNIAIPDDDDEGQEVKQNPTFNENLAEVLPDTILQAISTQLLKDIEEDDASRSEWLQMRDRCLGLLGLKIMKPRTDVSSGGAPFEGLSSYQDPLLLESSVRFQANARGELLPCDGPVKIENNDNEEKNEIADALEKAVNVFLTVGSPEYYPDTDKLLFQVGWSGVGFKKGYHCPMRRRPVIESIDAKDLIVSNQTTDIDTATRITHQISMSPTVLKRMQLTGVYREVSLSTAEEENKTAVNSRLETLQGIRKNKSQSPDNNERTILESYVDWDIPGFEHKMDGEITGLPIPYIITIDKSSRQILSIRRNYEEGDEWCNKKKTFVMYSYIRSFGFYPIGLMHLIGNVTNAITAMYRIAIDNGMINNYPYWLYAKSGMEQDKNDFRAGPGQGIPINVPSTGNIRDFIMAAPTKGLDPAFATIIQQLKQDAARLAGTAETQVGEGNQNAPVGTTIALIEQKNIPLDAVHKNLHQAQSEEFRMLEKLLQEDPEALWRHTGKEPDNKELLIQALNDYKLVPQADPNASSHIKRMSQAEAVKQIITQLATQPSPDIIIALKEATDWYCDQIGVPAAKKFILSPPPGQQPPMPQQGGGLLGGPDPLKAMSAIKTQEMKSNDAAQERQLKAVEIAQKSHDAMLDRQAKMQQYQDELAREMVIHTTPKAAPSTPINNNPSTPINNNPSTSPTT